MQLQLQDHNLRCNLSHNLAKWPVWNYPAWLSKRNYPFDIRRTSTTKKRQHNSYLFHCAHLTNLLGLICISRTCSWGGCQLLPKDDRWWIKRTCVTIKSESEFYNKKCFLQLKTNCDECTFGHRFLLLTRWRPQCEQSRRAKWERVCQHSSS